MAFEFVERKPGEYVGDVDHVTPSAEARPGSCAMPAPQRPLRGDHHAGQIINGRAGTRFLVLLVNAVHRHRRHRRRRSDAAGRPADLSDVQVIVYTEFPGQAPQVVEDQVTYPLTTACCRCPERRSCAASRFRRLLRHVIFEDGTDIYWTRRVLEYLNFASGPCPRASPTLGPDATGVGWVYQYAVLSPRTRRWPSCGQLQDWYVRYQLAKARASPKWPRSAVSSRPTR